MELSGEGDEADGFCREIDRSDHDVCQICKLCYPHQWQSHRSDLPNTRHTVGGPDLPYLFLICAEALSDLLTHVNLRGQLRGVPMSKKGPRLNHLFFADGSLLFCKADVTHWNQMSKILGLYERASGQRLNRAKTAIFFSKN
jgi:hypothetical protein